MSDAGRKSFTDKASEAIKPESEKSYLEKGKESITNAADSFAAKNTPDNQKSLGQTVADNAKQGHDDAKEAVGEHQATLADSVSEYAEAAKEQIGNAVNYVSGVVTGATEGAKDASAKK